MNIKKKLDAYLKSYLEIENRKGFFAKSKACGSMMMDYECASINDYIDDNKDEDTFQTYLFKLIDERELKDSDVYNKVNIDRRLFSKIRSNKDYHPSKETIILFGLALELSENEIEELLSKASYSLPMNNNFDLIIRFCFKEKIYDVNTINEFLYEHNCKLLSE
jgi:hypothetical protein